MIDSRDAGGGGTALRSYDADVLSPMVSRPPTEAPASGGFLQEMDGPHVAPPIREGLGSALIKRGLPTATVEHDLKPEGLQCRIELPLTARA